MEGCRQQQNCLYLIKGVRMTGREVRVLQGGRKCHNYSVWSYDQNYAYILYLSNYRWAFKDQFTRKKYQVFMHMSLFMATRNHNQIKSHHQKMLMKYGSIDQTIRGTADHTKELIDKVPQIAEVVLRLNQKFQQFYYQDFKLRPHANHHKNLPQQPLHQMMPKPPKDIMQAPKIEEDRLGATSDQSSKTFKQKDDQIEFLPKVIK